LMKYACGSNKSRRGRHGPVLANGAVVANDLSVVAPRVLDGVRGSDTSASGVTAGTEPVVLRSTSRSRLQSVVRGSVDCVSEHVVGENRIVRDQGGSQVVGKVIEQLHDLRELAGSVLGDDLERAEQFGGQQLSLPGVVEMLQRHLDCSGLIGAILGWDTVVLQRGSTEQELGSIESKDSVNMSLDLVVVPGEDRADGEVLQVSLGGLSLHLLKKVSLRPLLMHEQYRLSRALLAGMTVSIVVALPSSIVNALLGFGDVNAEDLPIEPSIFESNLALELLHEMLTDLG